MGGGGRTKKKNERGRGREGRGGDGGRGGIGDGRGGGREEEGGKGRGGVVHLLFEVPPLLLVHQNQVDIVTNRELLVDVPHGGRQVIPTQEQANGNGLTCRMEWRHTPDISQQERLIMHFGCTNTQVT